MDRPTGNMGERPADDRRRMAADLNAVAARRIAELKANLDLLRNSAQVDFAPLIRECEDVIATIQQEIHGLDGAEA